MDNDETGKMYFNNSNCVRQELGKSMKTKSPFLYLDDDENDLDDDEMGKINFKNSNCLRHGFGESMKTQIAIPPLGRRRDRLGR